MPILDEKSISKYDDKCTLFGLSNDTAREIYDNISEDSKLGNTYVIGLEDKILMMVRDSGHALTIEIDNNPAIITNLKRENFRLLKMADDYNILLIEEPEAHLHPAMQYQLFKYLQNLEDLQDEKIKNQIIITTHSPNISASSNIDDMISLHYYREKNNCNVNAENLKMKFISDDNKKQECLNDDKKHLAKFLDVTRSDMLFTEKVILVEGLTEKLLLPFITQKEGFNLVNEHISVVEVGGINFRPFLNIFKETNNKILCIRDDISSNSPGCLIIFFSIPITRFELLVILLLIVEIVKLLFDGIFLDFTKFERIQFIRPFLHPLRRAWAIRS